MLVLVVCSDDDRWNWVDAFGHHDWEVMDPATGQGDKPDLLWVVDDGARRGPGALLGTMEDPPPMVLVTERVDEMRQLLKGYENTKVESKPKSLAGTRRLVENMIIALFPKQGRQVDVGTYQSPSSEA